MMHTIKYIHANIWNIITIWLCTKKKKKINSIITVGYYTNK